ncbi:HesA/MoeB/ThiF family protein [Asanoa iriomotensis]|uniref:HesA/MoeB/ThiF family protein n=1 Tax=Asanoa iriomotensis TaxID=234613 RepID=UPI0019433401|nr:ThiF family adenylyltransferase [Asanoa iriomotensis]
MLPQLKDVAWKRSGADVQVVYDLRESFVVTDANGTFETLLELLREGGRGIEELAAALSQRSGREVPVDDVEAAIQALDGHRLLQNGERLGRPGDTANDRHYSNVAFFESFATLARSNTDLHSRIRRSHVLVLGTGGLNSTTIPHLCGLGVGRLTLTDRDVVQPRNFARQYLYRWRDLGRSKVDAAAGWVREFDPDVRARAITASIDGPTDVLRLLDEVAPDIVMSGVDSPDGVDDWVDGACVTRGVPYVRAGLWVTQGIVWSVDPGRSACRGCVRITAEEARATAVDDSALALAGMDLFRAKPRTNRAIGPVAGLLGSLAAFEVVRYLTRFESPVYAGNPLEVDFAAGCAMRTVAWRRNAGCACAATTVGSQPRPTADAAG